MLPNPNPLSVPARVYDQLHIQTLFARQPTPTTGDLSIELRPSTEDGLLAPDTSTVIVSVPIHPTVDEVPELAAAFEAVLAAIPAVLAWRETRFSS